MIKVYFKYRTKTKDLGELQNKFKQSADPKFKSEPSNQGIEMMSKIEGEDTIVMLEIKYNSVEDYQKRTEFERNQKAWNEIWFGENNKHIEEAVEIFEY